jgi:PAS domain S-box-containing protein
MFKTLGYLPEDVMGKKFVRFIHPDDLPIFQNFLTQSVDNLSVSTPIVMRHQHINGDWIYLESVCCNLLQDPNVQGLVINSRDITERKRTEAALEESGFRLAAIASSMPATLYRLAITNEGKISIPFISDGLIDLAGILPRYAISDPYQLLDLIHPEDVDQFKALIKAGFDKLATFRHEFRIITIAGEVKWVQNITRYYRTDAGMVLADGVCIDISEKGEAESSLQHANELLRAVIKAVPVAIDIVSPEGKVLLWNATAEKLFDWNTSAIVGHPAPNISESQTLELQSAILNTLAERPLEAVQMTFQLHDGSWTKVSMSTILVRDLHGKIIGVLRIIDELGDRSSINPNNSQILQQSDRSSLVRSSPEAIANFVTITANTLLNQYQIGQRNFAGLNLRGAYFVEADLQQADFSGAALNGGNCSHANFQSTNLRGADLRGANFQSADLQWADLRGADLRGADLRDANTTGAMLDDIDFLGSISSI